MRRRTSVVAATVAITLGLGLAGCSSTGADPTAGVPLPTASTTAGPTPSTSASPTPNATPGTLMDVDRFWQLVAGTYAQDPGEQAANLEPRLQALSPTDLAAFQRRYVQLADALNTPAHYSAAQVVMGEVSQDTFVDLRTWVVYQGRADYEAFLADPDSMAEWGPTDDEQLGAAESLESLPDHVSVVTPPWADDATTVYVDPPGQPQRLSYAQLRQRFPRLSATYLPPDLTAATPWDDGPRSVHRYS